MSKQQTKEICVVDIPSQVTKGSPSDGTQRKLDVRPETYMYRPGS